MLYVKDIGLRVSGCSEFECFDKGLISLHQEPWQGWCLDLHIASEHYTGYHEKSVKSSFRWLLTGLFRLKDYSNNFGQLSTVTYYGHIDINVSYPSPYIIFME